MKTRWLPLRVRLAVCCLGLIALALVGSVPLVSAGITKVVITTKESPTFGGYSWPGVGQYEKLVGMAFGPGRNHEPSFRCARSNWTLAFSAGPATRPRRSATM